MGDYEDDACVDAQHVHDAAGNIIERNPQTAIFLKALRKEVFLGSEVHNKMMVEVINNLNRPVVNLILGHSWIPAFFTTRVSLKSENQTKRGEIDLFRTISKVFYMTVSAGNVTPCVTFPAETVWGK
jgi:hypothetical protein